MVIVVNIENAKEKGWVPDVWLWYLLSYGFGVCESRYSKISAVSVNTVSPFTSTGT
jgi:hypothetical protein